MALYDGFRVATVLGRNALGGPIYGVPMDVGALIVEVPFPQLLEEFLLVALILGPAHVENVRVLGPARHQVFHKGGTTASFVIRVPTGEFGLVAGPDLDLEAVQTRVLVQQGNKSNLMGAGAENQIPGHEEGPKKVLGPGIVSHVIKPGVGRIRGVEQRVVSVVLKVHVKVVVRIGRVVEPLQRVSEPDDIDVLEENVVSQHGDQVDTVDLGGHHFLKGLIGVRLGGLRWHGLENRLEINGTDSEQPAQAVGFGIGREHENVVEDVPESLGAGVASDWNASIVI